VYPLKNVDLSPSSSRVTSESSRVESSRVESSRVESSRVESSRVESSRVESSQSNRQARHDTTEDLGEVRPPK
jgi:hypothetical protein